MVLFGPLLFPIARQLGVHEVHYAMVVVLSMGLGLFAPPLGVGYYAACAIGRVSPDAGIRPIAGYLLAAALPVAAAISFSIWRRRRGLPRNGARVTNLRRRRLGRPRGKRGIYVLSWVYSPHQSLGPTDDQ